MPLNHGTGVQYPWMHKKINRARFVIQQWLLLSDRAVYHSISGGKDSLVVGHLIREQYPDCPMVWINQGHLAEWDDCIELLELLKSQGWNITEMCPLRGLIQLYQEYGLPLSASMNTKEDKAINKALIYDVIEDWHWMNGDCFQGYSLGLRRESRGRTMLIQSKGELFQRKDGMWQCLPIGFWKTEDVWHYIDALQLPYPAIYDVDRMTVRNGSPFGTTGSCRGRLSFLRKHYPKQWDQFVSYFPEIVNYA